MLSIYQIIIAYSNKFHKLFEKKKIGNGKKNKWK